MSDVGLLLSKLRKVRKTGQGRWMACCPAHEDRSPSLAVRDDAGKILIKCFAGCSTGDVVAAVGMELADLMPERRLTDVSMPRERAPFLPSDAFDLLRQEVATAWVIVQQAATGGSVDVDRLTLAAQRLDAIERACYGRA
ncbi:MAG: CHC2 zinc finger domain-containing protein [Pseudomonadota bacterium]